MRALVTGGAGFIGSHLVDRFLQEGYEVRILDNIDSRVHPFGVPKHLNKSADLIVGSVTDRAAWERALEGGVDVISHQAAYQDYMLDFSKFLEVNAVSTALLYEILVEKKLRPRKVIVASSQSVYGEGQYDCSTHGLFQPGTRSHEQMRKAQWEVCCPTCGKPAKPRLLSEEHVNPVNQYAVSKHAGERAALGLGRLHGIPSVALRYSITQGPRQSLYNQYSGILRIFLRHKLSGKPLVIYEDGLQTRDFVHIQDVVDANFKVLADDRADFNAFNVGGGKATTILDYTADFIRKTNSKLEICMTGQYRVGDNRHSVSSIAKLQALGWTPRLGLDRIMGDFLAWADELGVTAADIPEAIGSMQTAGVLQESSASVRSAAQS